jgi:hypothetical protein
VFAQLTEWAGEMSWPATYWVATPSGGWHLYFIAPADSPIRNSAGLLGPEVDVRAQGGYVVGAGSVVGGKPYAVLEDRQPAPLPGWLHRRLTVPCDQPGPRRLTPGAGLANLQGLVQTVRDSQPGQQTDTPIRAMTAANPAPATNPESRSATPACGGDRQRAERLAEDHPDEAPGRHRRPPELTNGNDYPVRLHMLQLKTEVPDASRSVLGRLPYSFWRDAHPNMPTEVPAHDSVQHLFQAAELDEHLGENSDLAGRRRSQ